jgi:hypothetical protein
MDFHTFSNDPYDKLFWMAYHDLPFDESVIKYLKKEDYGDDVYDEENECNPMNYVYELVSVVWFNDIVPDDLLYSIHCVSKIMARIEDEHSKYYDLENSDKENHGVDIMNMFADKYEDVLLRNKEYIKTNFDYELGWIIS